MKGNLRLKKLPCSSHHKKYLIGQYKSVSISGASWRARMTDIWQDLQSWSCLAPQPDGRHLIIHPRRCIILVLRENFLPFTAALSYMRLRPGQHTAVQDIQCSVLNYCSSPVQTVFWLEQSALEDSVKFGGETVQCSLYQPAWHADILTGAGL